MKLSPVQRDTILAALRLFQSHLEAGKLTFDFEDLATNGGQHALISPQRIDALCQALNFGDDAEPDPTPISPKPNGIASASGPSTAVS